MKHIVRLLTLLLSLFSIFGLATFIVTKKAINIEAITTSLSDRYKFSASKDVSVSYLPFPKIHFRNASIKSLDDKEILHADELEFSFSIASVVKLMISNQTAKNIDKVTIIGGYVNIDDFINFASGNSIASGLEVKNALISNSFFSSMDVKDYKGNVINHGLGRVSFKLAKSFGTYKFSGYFVNNEALNFEGSLGDTVEFRVYGKGVEISKNAKDANLSDVKIDINNFELINDTIFESFPDYIKNNLAGETLKIEAVYHKDIGITEFKNIDGSILKGSGNVRKMSNGLNISVINLQSVNWGKKIDDIQNGFFKQALLNFNSVSKNGYAIFAQNIKIHGDSYNDFRLLLVKSPNGINLQELSLNGVGGKITANANYDDNNAVSKGSLSVQLAPQSKMLKDIISYLVSYRTSIDIPESSALNLDLVYELNKESSIFYIKSLNLDNISASASLKFSADKSEHVITVSNLNISKIGFSPVIYDALDSLFYTEANAPQTFLNNLSFISGENRLVLNLNNVTFNDKQIDNASIDITYTDKILNLHKFLINDEQARLSVSGVLDNTKVRPYTVIKANISYLDTAIFKYFSRDENLKLSNLNTFLWSANGFDLPKWDKFDGTINIIADRVILNKTPLENIQISTEFAQGHMKINRSNLGVFGGNIDFSGYFKKFNNSLDLTFVLKDADFELTENQESRYFSSLTGPYTLFGNIKTSGNSIFEYVNNINGVAEFTSPYFRALNFDIDSVVFNIAKYRQNLNKEIISILEVRASSTGFTDFKNVKAKFVIDNGIVRSDNISFVTKYTTGKGAMSFDLPKLSYVVPAIFTMESIPYKGAPITNIVLNISGEQGTFKKSVNLDSVRANFAPRS